MNTTVEVEGADVSVAPYFARIEALLSRFDPGSALCRLNARPGCWVVVPPLLLRAVSAALRAAAETDGAFDPTVLPALEAAGYRRSFEQGPSPPALPAPPVPPAPPAPAGRWREVRLDPRLGAVWLPEGVRLDLGGIGKGLTVDWAMDRLERLPRLLINAGGDLAVRRAPGDAPALVEVQDPLNPEQVLATFGLMGGAVATSSTLGRCWGTGLHHIIDPTSGRPAATDVVAATVVANSTARAEVLSKACIVLGRQRGLQLLADRGSPGVLVSAEGTWTVTPEMEAHLHAGA